MATVKELRSRIRSLRNTRKITSAMKMISAVKLRKARDASTRAAGYLGQLEEMLAILLRAPGAVRTPLLGLPGEGKTRIFLVTTDRGLCGGFNNTLLRFYLEQLPALGQDPEVCAIGRRGREFLRRRGMPLLTAGDGVSGRSGLEKLKSPLLAAAADFLAGKISRVVMIHNRYVSSLNQQPTLLQLLPFDPAPLAKMRVRLFDYLIEPERDETVRHLLPQHLSARFQAALLSSATGEHATRMNAMENATRNADELIARLTLQMNRARQSSITRELIEVVTGAESLKN